MSSHKVALYFCPGASSFFPHILLHHCKIPFTPVPIILNAPNDITALANVNTKGQVPVLDLDGEVITENPAIAHAIHSLAPEAKIFGKSTIESIRVCEWMNWIAASLHAQAWSPWIRPWRFTTDKAGEAGVKEASEKTVRERFAILESKLDPNGPWALGENFTAVDAYILPFFRLARGRMKADVTEFPRWQAIYNRSMEMEAVKQALHDEQVAMESVKKAEESKT